MAYINSNNNIVLQDSDNDDNAWSSGAAITGLIPNVPINVSIVSINGSTADSDYAYVSLSKYTNDSWDYYDTVQVQGIGSIVTVSVNEGENLVLYDPEDSFMEISLVYYVEPVEVDVYAQPSIVPAAISSELDNHGEERIHIAPYVDVVVPKSPEEVCANIQFSPYEDPRTVTELGPENSMPSWWSPGAQFAVRFPGTEYVYYFSFMEDGRYKASGPNLPFSDYEEILHGEIALATDDSPENYDWSCLHATTYAPA